MCCRPAVPCCPPGYFQHSPMLRVMSAAESGDENAVLRSLLRGSIILQSLSLPPLSLLSSHLLSLPPSPPLLTLVCADLGLAKLPLPRCSVPVSALCSPSLVEPLYLCHTLRARNTLSLSPLLVDLFSLLPLSPSLPPQLLW